MGLEEVLFLNEGSINKFFGQSIALDNDVLAIGAPRHNPNDIHNGGIVRLYYRHEGFPDSWGHKKDIVPDNLQQTDYFGRSISLDQDTLAVGSRQNELGSKAGSVYIFERHEGGEGNWGEIVEIFPGNNNEFAKAGAEFGASVSLSHGSLLVGARYEDVDDISEAGAAYLFRQHLGGTDNWGTVTQFLSTDWQQDDIEAENRFGYFVKLTNQEIIIYAKKGDDSLVQDAGSITIHKIVNNLLVDGFE